MNSGLLWCVCVGITLDRKVKYQASVGVNNLMKIEVRESYYFETSLPKFLYLGCTNNVCQIRGVEGVQKVRAEQVSDGQLGRRKERIP